MSSGRSPLVPGEAAGSGHPDPLAGHSRLREDKERITGNIRPLIHAMAPARSPGRQGTGAPGAREPAGAACLAGRIHGPCSPPSPKQWRSRLCSEPARFSRLSAIPLPDSMLLPSPCDILATPCRNRMPDSHCWYACSARKYASALALLTMEKDRLPRFLPLIMRNKCPNLYWSPAEAGHRLPLRPRRQIQPNLALLHGGLRILHCFHLCLDHFLVQLRNFFRIRGGRGGIRRDNLYGRAVHFVEENPSDIDGVFAHGRPACKNLRQHSRQHGHGAIRQWYYMAELLQPKPHS